MTKEDKEKPIIKPFKNKRKTFKTTPKIVIPKKHIKNKYDKLINKLFLKDEKKTKELESMLLINKLILSITIFSSSILIIFEYTAPKIKDKKKKDIIKILTFL